MRSKYLEKLVSLALSIISYAVLLPIFIFTRDFIGLENGFVFGVIQLLVFLVVYGFVSIFVEKIFKRLNERLLLLRKANGGRDIAAEEQHEDETGLISLSLNNKK